MFQRLILQILRRSTLHTFQVSFLQRFQEIHLQDHPLKYHPVHLPVLPAITQQFCLGFRLVGDLLLFQAFALGNPHPIDLPSVLRSFLRRHLLIFLRKLQQAHLLVLLLILQLLVISLPISLHLSHQILQAIRLPEFLPTFQAIHQGSSLRSTQPNHRG